jgi:hypothetical protein
MTPPNAAGIGPRWSGLLLAGWVLLGTPTLLPAQQNGTSGGRGYVHLPFSGNLEDLLKQRLRQAEGRENFERFLKQFQEKGSKFELNKEMMEKLKEDAANPLVRSKLDAMRQGADLSKFDPEKIEEFKRAFNKYKPTPQDKMTSPPDETRPVLPPNPGAPVPPPGGQRPPGTEATRVGDSDWVRDLFEGLEHSKVGEILQDSPAFQEAVLEMQHAMLTRRDEGADSVPWGLGGLAERVRLPDGWDLPRMGGSWQRLRELPMPSLPRPSFSAVGLGGWRWAPPAPSSPGGGIGIGQVVLWVVLLTAGGFLVWQLLARMKSRGLAVAGAGAALGPWPVVPGQVASRADVIRAFDYLALLLLGSTARTANHWTIAEGLAGEADAAQAQRQNAAAELAALYEQARYAPDEGPLPAEALAAARRDLCLLAGVPHA